MLKRFLTLATLLALAALFVAGVGRLCVLRFRSGDVYPPLSSLRGDPLGVKALHDALADTGGTEVRRNYRPLFKLHAAESPRTLFYLGENINSSTADWDDLWQLAVGGNRVVIAFAPVTSTYASTAKPMPDKTKASPTPGKAKKPAKKKSKKQDDDDKEEETLFVQKWISWEGALKRLGITYHTEKAWERIELKAHAAPELVKGADVLEPVISWHSVAWLEATGTNQRTLYSCTEKPVIVERPVGKGSIVFATDAYFLTNEALRNERSPHLLAALIGENREIVFDEYHLHSIEEAGVSTLVRQYRMEGVFVVFALLAALYVWKNAAPLIPRTDGAIGKDGAGETIAGRDATEGFVNLLRRSIPPARIIGVCIEEWNNAFAHLRGEVPQPAQEKGADPVNQFSELAKQLSNKRTR